MNTKLYDIEDDIIDRGDATNMDEALDYYNIERIYQHDKNTHDKLNDFNIRVESDYYNSYYINGSFTTKTIKLNNKLYHKLNDNSRKIK
ncbi:MAG: hypothetical protein CMP37_03750 [Rickettsiales bacterium]|nr:hypothetical protein [Rickettsiales bacterium]|tara:strand:- start:13003 stop:13269 length:267 start_codon:yes stop_codon:yes gene_type:complete